MTSFPTMGFLDCLASVFYPGTGTELVRANLGGRSLQTLRFKDGRLLGVHPALDFFLPVAQSDGTAVDASDQFIGRLSREVVPAKDFKPNTFVESTYSTVAPFIDWGMYPTWDTFQAAIIARKKDYFRDSARQRKRLAAEVGPLQCLYGTNAQALLETMLAWKALRLREIGARDLFTTPLYRSFLHLLVERGELKIDALMAGERPIAIHAGFQVGGRFFYWLPAFDASMKPYSAGRLLLEDLLARSHDSKDLSFEFMNGAESYKFMYATTVRMIGSVGNPPLRLAIRERLGAVYRDLRRRRHLHDFLRFY